MPCNVVFPGRAKVLPWVFCLYGLGGGLRIVGCGLLILSMSKALLGSRGRVAPHALTALLGMRRVKMRVILTSNQPACKVLPLTGGLRLNGCNKCVLSCGNTRIVGTGGKRMLLRQHVGPRVLPCLRGGTHGGKFTVFACARSQVVTSRTSGRRVLRRTFLGQVRLVRRPRFSITISFTPSGYVLIDSSRRTLVKLRRR